MSPSVHIELKHSSFPIIHKVDNNGIEFKCIRQYSKNDKEFIFSSAQILMYTYKSILFSLKSLLYIFIKILGKNDFPFILWISSHAFELDANIVNFVYYGKTQLATGYHQKQ